MCRKWIYVSGYFKGNFGDDLFLHILLDRYPNSKFLIMAEKSKYVGWNNNLNVFNVENRIYNKLFNVLMKYNVNINRLTENVLYFICKERIKLGGSLFMEDVGTHEILRKEYQKKQYHIIGANIGPIYTEEYVSELLNIFELSKDICLRDKESYNIAKSVRTVRYAPDIAFQLDISMFDNVIDRNVFLSVIDLNRRIFSEEQKRYYDLLLDYIINTFHKKGYTITLASFCEREGDGRKVQELLEKYPFTEGIFYKGNIKDVILKMNSAEYIFATRFHAMIMGFLLHKKTIPIVYSDKMLNVMNDVEYDNDYYDIRKVKKTLNIDLEKYCDVNVSGMIKDSEDHFKKLDEVLGRRNG